MKIIFAVLLAIIISGCDSKPGDGIIKKHIVTFNNEQYNTLGLGKIVSIKNIKVVNGFEKLIDGSPYYTAFVEYDLVFLKEPKEIITELQNMANNADKITKDAAGLRDALGKISRAGMLLQTLVEMSLSDGANKSNTIQETFILKKGDKGWFVTSSEPGWTEMQ